MTNRMNLRVLASAAALFLFPFVPQAQEAETPARPVEEPESPLLRLDDLTLVQYRPANLGAEELYHFSFDLVGRYFWVEERGGLQGNPIENLSVLGREIVVYDTEPYVRRVLELFHKLDVPHEEEEAAAPLLETIQYRPRYLTLESAHSALGSYNRVLRSQETGGAGGPNISAMRERGLLVIRDRLETLAEIRGLLARLDVPEPQVLITCYLLADGGREDAGLPPELAQNLGALLPGFRFQRMGFAFLQVAATPGDDVELDLGNGYQLSLEPRAFDTETGSLTVRQCSLRRRVADSTQRVFTTSTILRGGEYTVLGAGGSDPVFVALGVARR